MKKLIILCACMAVAIHAHSQNVIRGEYFIDADPGFGSGTPFTITLPDTDITQALNIPHSAFTGAGYHYVYMRTLDANGSWNLTAKRIVEAEDNPYALNVIKVEYFFDADNGFGSNSFALLNASADSTWNFDIPYNQLPASWTSNDTLFLRVQDSARNDWSLTTTIDSLNFSLVGINELTEASGASVFPNPFSDELTITLDKEAKVRMVLYNVAGQLVFYKVIEHTERIHTAAWAPGTYTVFVSDDKHAAYRSVIIKQ